VTYFQLAKTIMKLLRLVDSYIISNKLGL